MFTKLGRAGAVVAAAIGMLVIAPSADAVEPLPITCTTAAAVDTQHLGGGTYSWAISGAGSCQGDFEGTYVATVVAAGSSQGLGRCDDSGVVQNLNLNATVTLVNPADPDASKIRSQNWSAGLTNYPQAVPFIIDGGLGAGTILTRLFGLCNPLGTPVAQIVFTFPS